MRYLITGGAGFLGSHLTRALAEAGHEISVLDDLSTGKKENLPPEAVLELADVADASAVERALSKADGCFHLAAIASVQKAEEDWRRAHEVNCVATAQLLRTAAARDVPVVYASSAAVYGEGRPPHRENARAQPVSVYGVDKLACELHAAALARNAGLSSVGLRFFNLYGPGQDPDSPYSGVISRFAAKLSQNAPLTLYGDGAQTRDFVYIADAVSACLRAMSGLEARAFPQEIFNVCTGRETSIKKLAMGMAKLAGTPLSLEYAASRPGDIYYSHGSPEHFRRWGFSCATALEEGLKWTFAWLAP